MKYEYIIDSRGFYVVPWTSTREAKDKREKYFSEKFGVKPLIVSPDLWEDLLCRYEMHIFETEDK